MNDYQFSPFRRDRNRFGGGKIASTRQSLMARSLCVELTISKKEWCILIAYRSPQNNNLKPFFEETNLLLSTIVNEY